MPKKASSDLSDLIFSLTKNEAGYFKKFSARHSAHAEKDYLRLFNELSENRNQTVPNGQGYRNFSRLKNYLHQSILLALESYHGNSNSNSKLRGYLADIELLYGKALYGQCKKILKKAHALAVRYEKFNAIIELIGWEIRILQATVELDLLQKRSAHFLSALHTAFARMQNITGYQLLYARIFGLIRKIGPPNNSIEKKAYHHIISDPLMNRVSMAETSYAQMLFHHIRSVYHFSNREPEKERKETELLIHRIETSPELLEEESERYVIALNNHISSSIRMRKFAEAPPKIQKLRSLRTGLKKNPYALNLSHRIFARAFIQELWLFNTMGDPGKALQVIAENEKELKRTRTRINLVNETELYLRISYSYFMAEEYKKALSWLNKILTDRSRKDIRQFYSYALLLNLCTHYQLGNYKYAGHLAGNCRKELKQNGELNLFESELISCITRLTKLNATHKKEKNRTLTLYLDLLSKHPDPTLISYIDVISWMESQRSGLRMAQIIENKLNTPL